MRLLTAAAGILLSGCVLCAQLSGYMAQARSKKSGSQAKSTTQSGRMRTGQASRKGHPTAFRTSGGRRASKSTGQTKSARRPTVSPVAARQEPKPAADAAEPKPMPDNYEQETRLLSKVYRLRDQALNEQLRGDLGDAVRHLVEAAEISSQYYGKPESAEAGLYMDLAVAAESAGQYELSRNSYLQTLVRNPGLIEARIRLSTLLAKRGQSEEAVEEARKAVESNPYDPRGHHLLGLLLERRGEWAHAELEKSKSRSLLGPRRLPRIVRPEPPPPEIGPATNTPAGSEEIPADMPLGLP